MSDAFHGKQDCSREQLIVQAAGRRRYRRRAGNLCADCRVMTRIDGHSYCHECHAARVRAYRARQKEKRAAEQEELQCLRAELRGEHNGHQSQS